MPTPEISIATRLADLETAHTRLKRFVVSLLVAGLVLASFGAAEIPPGKIPPGTTVAKALHLIDDEGKVRILINPRAGVALLDGEGRPRAVLSLDNTGGPGLALYGASSKTGTILNVNDDGPSLAMRDNDGRTRALLTAIAPGPALILSDEKERESIALIQQGETSSLSIVDRRGTIVWQAP